MILLAAHIQVPGISAKWMVGSVALFHTAVASLAIGFAFVVTVLQIVGYRLKDRRYDLLAKRVQLLHVCMYNIGTINAIGLVFILSGLYPEFWSQLFTHFFWTMILEEFCFFLLATTLTFHYFFWDNLWGHKKLHIFLGALMTPLFIFQFYYINGMGGFMLTPGYAEGQISQWAGTVNILGWDFKAFYNPSFLMLTLHRTLANISYGAFIVAAVCGFRMFFTKRPKLLRYYEGGGQAGFFIGFSVLLSLPVVGYFYAFVLKTEAEQAYVNLMWGKGDVAAGGIDWWWVKHIIVAAMVGMGLAFFRYRSKHPAPTEKPLSSAEAVASPLWSESRFAMPGVMVYSMALLYVIFYAAMGMVMTWKFFWIELASAVIAGLIATHLLKFHKHSGRAVFMVMGTLAFLTVLLGGYVREASRPRFVNKLGDTTPGEARYSHYDNVYRPNERQTAGPMRMMPRPKEEITYPPISPEQRVPYLITIKCIGCHTLAKMKQYPREDWPLIVRRMKAYGTKISAGEEKDIVEHLQAKKPY